MKSYDPNRELTIQTDASQNGLGSCLLQDSNPIAYSSRSLSENEIKYSQIEKEFLAITYACKKFHQYIFGRTVIVKSDHKPIMYIMDKEIPKISSAKLQRIRITFLNYDLKVQYLPGR